MYEKSLSITLCLFPYKRFKNFSIFVCSSFTGTDQFPGGKQDLQNIQRHHHVSSRTDRWTCTYIHTNIHRYIHTYTDRVDFHWGLPMKLCNLYRKTFNACQPTRTLSHIHISLENTWGRILKNITTGLSHMKPPLEEEA